MYMPPHDNQNSSRAVRYIHLCRCFLYLLPEPTDFAYCLFVTHVETF